MIKFGIGIVGLILASPFAIIGSIFDNIVKHEKKILHETHLDLVVKKRYNLKEHIASAFAHPFNIIIIHFVNF